MRLHTAAHDIVASGHSHASNTTPAHGDKGSHKLSPAEPHCPRIAGLYHGRYPWEGEVPSWTSSSLPSVGSWAGRGALAGPVGLPQEANVDHQGCWSVSLSLTFLEHPLQMKPLLSAPRGGCFFVAHSAIYRPMALMIQSRQRWKDASHSGKWTHGNELVSMHDDRKLHGLRAVHKTEPRHMGRKASGSVRGTLASH